MRRDTCNAVPVHHIKVVAIRNPTVDDLAVNNVDVARLALTIQCLEDKGFSFLGGNLIFYRNANLKFAFRVNTPTVILNPEHL